MKNREVINSYIDKWIEDYNNRQRPVWNYEDGCVMLGAQYLYEATGDEKVHQLYSYLLWTGIYRRMERFVIMFLRITIWIR